MTEMRGEGWPAPGMRSKKKTKFTKISDSYFAIDPWYLPNHRLENLRIGFCNFVALGSRLVWLRNLFCMFFFLIRNFSE
jgi:hypothetical protein